MFWNSNHSTLRNWGGVFLRCVNVFMNIKALIHSWLGFAFSISTIQIYNFQTDRLVSLIELLVPITVKIVVKIGISFIVECFINMK